MESKANDAGQAGNREARGGTRRPSRSCHRGATSRRSVPHGHPVRPEPPSFSGFGLGCLWHLRFPIPFAPRTRPAPRRSVGPMNHALRSARVGARSWRRIEGSLPIREERFIGSRPLLSRRLCLAPYRRVTRGRIEGLPAHTERLAATCPAGTPMLPNRRSLQTQSHRRSHSSDG